MLQAVTKYTLQASAFADTTGQQQLQGEEEGDEAQQGGDTEGAPDATAAAAAEGLVDVNIRDAFVAPPGCVLLSADYGQVELRVLAHLSGDPALLRLLRQAGPTGDAFRLIASAWLGCGERLPLPQHPCHPSWYPASTGRQLAVCQD